jgi:2-iminobutanoate/2-iminopropanoate deaminase
VAREIVSTDQAPKPGGPYSTAVVANGFAFLAGQTPKRPDGSKVEGSFSEECEQVFDNLDAVAKACGASLHDAVKVSVFLRSWSDFGELNRIFAERFGDHPPARTTVPADLPGFSIEVDVILALPT